MTIRVALRGEGFLFQVWGLGFRVSSSRLGFWVSDFGFEFGVCGFGFVVSGFGFRVSGFGFRACGPHVTAVEMQGSALS